MLLALMLGVSIASSVSQGDKRPSHSSYLVLLTIYNGFLKIPAVLIGTRHTTAPTSMSALGSMQFQTYSQTRTVGSLPVPGPTTRLTAVSVSQTSSAICYHLAQRGRHVPVNALYPLLHGLTRTMEVRARDFHRTTISIVTLQSHVVSVSVGGEEGVVCEMHRDYYLAVDIKP